MSSDQSPVELGRTHTPATGAQQLAFCLEGSGLGTWEWNIQTGAARFNERWANLIGASLQELEPVSIDTWWNRVHSDDLQRSWQELQNHFSGNSSRYECEMRMRHAAGHWVWVLVSGAVLARTGDGTPEWMFGTCSDITGPRANHILAKQALEEANARLSLAADSGGIGIWDWDILTNALRWDRWMYRLYGIDEPSDASGNYQLWSSHLHPEDRAKTEQALRDGVAGIKPYQVDFRIVWTDGSIHHLRGTGHVVRDEEGRPVQMVGANWNVTDFHRLASELTEQRELLEVTLRSIGDAVITTDARGCVLVFNAVAEGLIGCSTAEAVGRPLGEVLHLTGEYSVSSLLQACITEGRVISMHNSTLLIARDGRTFDIEDSAAPIRKAGGEILGMVIIFHDVSKQKQVQERLQASEARFNAFMENSPALTFIKDREGHLVYMNPVCRKMWNFDALDWQGKTDAELWSPELAREFRKLDLLVLDTNAAGVNLDVVPLPGGKEISLLSYKFPLALPSGERLIGGVSIDISEQKEAEQRAIQALAEKEVLLKELHHRVKNNLQVISSLLRLQSQCVHDPEAIAALQAGRQRVYSMALIHEQLYSSEQVSHLDLASYTRTLVEHLVHAYSASGHVFPVVETSTVLVGVDQAIPCGLITNELVTNALKYAYPRGAAGPIKVSLSNDTSGRVRITVSDAGVGLPLNFNWKTSESMGLTIVDILARQLGGSWSFSNGQPGAQFTVEFPNERFSKQPHSA